MSSRLYDQLAAGISLVLLGILAVVTYYLAEMAGRDPNAGKQRKVTHEPDYFVEHFALTRLDAQGQPSFSLTADRLVHFPDDDSTEYVQPRLVSLDPSKPQVTLRAERGTSTSEGVQTHLHDNVVLTRAPTEGSAALTVKTEYILLLSEDDIARTDRFVRIESGESVLTGIGMEFNNAARQLDVRADVKGVWITPVKSTSPASKP